jgi:hypothetical protein
VHTFDCTVKGRVLDPARHTFHRICIGNSPGSEDQKFETFNSITRRLGHHKIALLKIDIEGWEFQAMGDLRETTQGLPEQIAIELHFAGGGQLANHLPAVAARNQMQMSLLFMHMANLGYGIVSREDNPIDNIGCCSEYTFLRVEQIPGPRKPS